MLKENTICLVKNRSAGRVAYSIPELGITRRFAPGEVKQITYGELVKLTYQPGGAAMIANFLQLQMDEAVNKLNINVQPEYFMNDEQIKELITSGSFEAFLDCLDFAPTGVIDLLKEYAVSIPLSDYKKREAMKEKLGFDVDKVLANKKAEEEEAKNPSGFVADASTTETKPASTRPAARRTTTTYKTTTAATTTAK